MIVIIMSGMGSDGTQGVRAVKEHLGVAMAQDPANAKYDSSPRVLSRPVWWIMSLRRGPAGPAAGLCDACEQG